MKVSVSAPQIMRRLDVPFLVAIVYGTVPSARSSCSCASREDCYILAV